MNKIKLLLLAVVTAVLGSCSSEKEEIKDGTRLEVASGLEEGNVLKLSSTATSGAFSVYASARPMISTGASWLKVTASEPSKMNGISKIELQCEPNNLSEERTAELELSLSMAISDILRVRVVQAGAEKQETPEPDPGEEPGNEESDFGPVINTAKCSIGGSTPREVTLSMGMGWNLGNQMDAFNNNVANETCWGNKPATPLLFETLKEHGFSTVRIPVTWLGHIGAAPGYEIDAGWLGRVVEIVEMAENAGLNAIVNIHHDGADSQHWLDIKNAAANSSKNEQIIEEIAAVWSQIAEAMKDKGDFLMFEAFNEIHDGGWGWGANRNDGGKQYACLNEWNQTFVDAVRKTGGNNKTRWLSVPSYVTNIDLAVEDFMVLPKDDANKVMVAVHFYDPNDFALNSTVTDWGHTGEASKKGSWIADEDYVVSQFAKLTDKWVNNNVPVYIGEMGPPNQKNERGNAFRNYYLEYVTKAAREAGLATIYWDNGAVGGGNDKFGLFDHGTGAIINNSSDAIKSMLTGATCDAPEYTLEWIYENRAPVF